MLLKLNSFINKNTENFTKNDNTGKITYVDNKDRKLF